MVTASTRNPAFAQVLQSESPARKAQTSHPTDASDLTNGARFDNADSFVAYIHSYGHEVDCMSVDVVEYTSTACLKIYLITS